MDVVDQLCADLSAHKSSARSVFLSAELLGTDVSTYVDSITKICAALRYSTSVTTFGVVAPRKCGAEQVLSLQKLYCQVLPTLSALRRVVFRDCGGLVDGDLATAINASCVTEVDVNGSCLDSDGAFAAFLHQLAQNQRIVELHMDAMPDACVTQSMVDAVAAYFRTATTLKRVSLRNVFATWNIDVKELCTALTLRDFERVDLGDVDSQHTALVRSLHCGVLQMSPQMCCHVVPPDSLYSLDLSGTAANIGSMARWIDWPEVFGALLQRYHNLRELNLATTALVVPHIEELLRADRLRVLDVTSCGLVDFTLSELAGIVDSLEHLRALYLGGNRFTQWGVVAELLDVNRHIVAVTRDALRFCMTDGERRVKRALRRNKFRSVHELCVDLVLVFHPHELPIYVYLDLVNLIASFAAERLDSAKVDVISAAVRSVQRVYARRRGEAVPVAAPSPTVATRPPPPAVAFQFVRQPARVRRRDPRTRLTLESTCVLHAFAGDVAVSPDGLRATCTGPAFATALSSFTVKAGRVLYEATVDKLAQVGWVAADFACSEPNHGVGDDAHSWAFCGHRQRLWHDGSVHRHYGMEWSSGDVVSCLLDCDAGVIAYYLRGSSLGMAFQFDMPPGGLRAAVSTSTSISVNFGAKPLAFDIYGYTPLSKAGERVQLVQPQRLSLSTTPSQAPLVDTSKPFVFGAAANKSPTAVVELADVHKKLPKFVINTPSPERQPIAVRRRKPTAKRPAKAGEKKQPAAATAATTNETPPKAPSSDDTFVFDGPKSSKRKADGLPESYHSGYDG